MALLLNRTKPADVPAVDITIDGRPVSVDISPEARSHLKTIESPVVAELEILFSCLVRKQVVFRPPRQGEATHEVERNLHLTVRAVMYELCEPSAGEREPPLVDFDAAKRADLWPRRVRVDYSPDGLVGTFSFS